jgi:hypothetical protein
MADLSEATSDVQANGDDAGATSMVSRLALGVVCVVLLFSGGSKLFGNDKPLPELLAHVLTDSLYQKLMLALGGVEVICAVLVVARKTRWWALHVVLIMLGVFCALITLSAADARFLANCGCGDPTTWLEGMHNAPAMLTRNALMACLVVIALGQRRHERYFWGTGICLSVALLMAQKRAAVADTDRDDGVQVAALPGMAIAQCSVRNGAGQTDSLANVLGPYGAVIAFAPTCAECRASLPFWRQVQARVEALGGRLVALAVSGGYTDARALLDQFGLGSVDLVSLVSVADGRRLGIGHLPHLIELDGRAHVRVATGQVRGIQLQAALQGAMESEDMLLALARALLPKLELRFVGPVLSTEAVVAGCVTGDEGRKLTVAIAMGWTPTGESAECVMVVDSHHCSAPRFLGHQGSRTR